MTVSGYGVDSKLVPTSCIVRKCKGQRASVFCKVLEYRSIPGSIVFRVYTNIVTSDKKYDDLHPSVSLLQESLIRTLHCNDQRI